MITDRREFIRKSIGAFGTLSMIDSLPNEFLGQSKPAASDRVKIGVIGCNGMGWTNALSLMKIPGVEILALCDVDENVLDKRLSELKQITGNKTRRYTDFRKLLDDEEIDAVVVATPDHWHCLITTMACEAKKHVYVEKPLGNSVGECLAMVSAQKQNNNVVQVGQWQRSSKHWNDAISFVRSGALGKIRFVKAWAYIDWKSSVPKVPNTAIPQRVNYDMWLGPASSRPFNQNRFHFNFRWYWDYAGGLTTDWGVHLLDIALLAMDAGTLKSVTSIGGKYAYPEDAMETPDSQTALFDFGTFSIAWEHSIGIGQAPYGRSHGIAFIGSYGTVVVDRDQWMLLPEKDATQYKMPAIPIRKNVGNGLDLHIFNFIQAVKDRNIQLNCPIDSAANTAIISHLGNIAYRTDRKLIWNAVKNSFEKNDDANRLIIPEYRSPWNFPSKYLD